MSILQSQKSFPKKSPLKLVMPRRYHLRSLTEHCQKIEDQKSKNRSINNIVLPLMEKSSEFPSIIVKQNRNQYIGYKQNIINKSKLAAFQHEQKEINHYQTQRKHEINLMNVDKLRKRYSLQPNSMLKIKKDYQNIFQSISKTIHNDPQNEQSISQRKYHKELREIMRLMIINKHTSQQKIPPNNQENTYQQGQTQNLSKSNHCSPTEESLLQNTPSLKKQLPFFTKKTKPYFAQLKRRVQNKVDKTKKQKEILFFKELTQEKSDLCGWSTHSFYSKCRGNNLIQNCPLQRPKFLQ